MAPQKEGEVYAKILAAIIEVAAVMIVCTIILNLLAVDPVVAEEVDENHAVLVDKWTRLKKIK